MNATADTIWEPPADAWDVTRLGGFAQRHCPVAFGDYGALWRWSVQDQAAFWRAIWDEFEIMSPTPIDQVMSSDPMPATRWFTGAQVNYAEHMLRGNGLDDNDVAVISQSQSRPERKATLAELRDDVGRCAAGLRRLGVRRGDRVAGLLPNIHEALVAFLATASIGAIWSSCAPEFGSKAVLDRWSQIEPVVLIVVDGYQYGSKAIDMTERVAAIRAGLPTVQHTVALRYLDGSPAISDVVGWDELNASTTDELTFEPVDFDHPLYVLYSSGTTGLPKAIVHGHGGILLEHSKQLALHMDLGPGDRFFWFSTTGWMMWNFLVSGLLVGSSIVLFDGDPGYPSLETLWSATAATKTTFAGFSAPFIMGCRKDDVDPNGSGDVSALRGIGSTGAPLPAAGFRWIADQLGAIPIASISGGTDVCSAFLGAAPVLAVTAGTIPCRQLGWSVDAFDAQAQPIRDAEGELVITKPAPSMPVEFWGDDGSRYHDAYFAEFDGVWRHGDWITIQTNGACIVSGRSDATLNRGGVRLGTADFYTIVEAHPSVQDSLVVHLEDTAEGGLGELLLFLVMKPGVDFDSGVQGELVRQLRQQVSPRHVPDHIVAVPQVPRTLSGKKLEVPVKRILQGDDPEKIVSTGALQDANALDAYLDYAKGRSS